VGTDSPHAVPIEGMPAYTKGAVFQTANIRPFGDYTSVLVDCQLTEFSIVNPMLNSLKFSNHFVDNLPGDPSSEVGPRQVYEAFYSRVSPRVCTSPRLVAWSSDTAKLLGLGDQSGVINSDEENSYASLLTGNALLPGMKPFAMCYGGHQFGHWAGQLGDGRAIGLGEIISADQSWALQLKGAGLTPYSRTADGFAVLRSSIREYLCSEAMHHLGIPTTRALSLVLTGDSVVRDMFYDGHPKPEPGAVVCRVSKAFIRFGSFEIFSSRGDKTRLKELADYTIQNFYPEIDAQYDGVDKYLQFYLEVVKRTAHLIAAWQGVGFVHGVMNTDNMSILGETIDYGPYGWLEPYDLNWTPNTTDSEGRRYAYANQPAIGMWNLSRLGTALLPLIDDKSMLQTALDTYKDEYSERWRTLLATKLGFCDSQDTDEELINEMFELMQLEETDMTLFFRSLSEVKSKQEVSSMEHWPELMRAAFYQLDKLENSLVQRWTNWLQSYAVRVGGVNDDVRAEQMEAVNPLYVCRNYLAQKAIDSAEEGDFTEVEKFLDVLKRPYTQQKNREMYAARRPEWARNKAGCSMLSCSS
jgi:serine/tyrosine/threonine adenylyltransferase